MLRSILVVTNPEPDGSYLNTLISLYRDGSEGFAPPPQDLTAGALPSELLAHFGTIVATLQAEAAAGGWWVEQLVVERGPDFHGPVARPVNPQPGDHAPEPPPAEPTWILAISDRRVSDLAQRTRSINTRELAGPVSVAVAAIWEALN